MLLYVGITASVEHRLRTHRRSKPWWDEVTRITVSRHESRSEAEAAERRVIQSEAPLYNSVHTPSHADRSTKPTHQGERIADQHGGEQRLDQRADDLDRAYRSLAADLCGVDDPVARARLAGPLIARFNISDDLAVLRRDAIAQAREAGHSWAAIGRELGISAARAQQIVTGRRR